MSFPLFELFPKLSQGVPRVALGAFPTPVESLHALARELGAGDSDAWIKRDDISSAVYGGNKVRTLELLLGQARARGHTSVLATGAFGSNHALATALHAPRVGLKASALLFPQPLSEAAFLNLRALTNSGALLHALPHWSAFPLAMAWLRFRTGPAPYVMVPGGATPLGALGYVSAGLELGRQIAAGALPVPRRVIVAVGSTCTSAGLLLGLTLAAHFRIGLEPGTLPRVTSVRVSPWPVTSRLRILGLAARTAHLLRELVGSDVPRLDSATLGAHFEVDGRYLGPGYGEPSAAGSQAEAQWERLGLPRLDGTYSAKAAARVVFGLRAREAGPVLFWSTKSSVPLPASCVDEAALSALPLRIRTWLLRAQRKLDLHRH
ncbi:MAG TPA: pyridoxal-phosphate dependent enzyme [Polyangiaceae bacterium]|nr:pyridoxal-phosphate dependent enzyme [Polyangiaceae bacterium]